MDDLVNDLSSRPMKLGEEAWHAEQERRKYDIYRVYNPTEKDFFVEYNTNQFQKFEPKKSKDVPFYIAERFIKHMTDKIINEMGQKMHDEQLADRDKKGLPKYTDKYVENNETYMTSNYPKTDNAPLRLEIGQKLMIGKVSEVGRDIPIDSPRSSINTPPPEQEIMSTLMKKMAPDSGVADAFANDTVNPFAQRPVTGFSTMNQKLSASDVTQE